MLRLIPAPLHRSGLRLADRLRRRWWRFARPRFAGCRVIALDEAGRVLLIRHSYGSGSWAPPGGGLSRREDALAGAMRELREETGCKLAEAVLIEVVDEPLHGATNTVHVVAGRTADRPVADGREVVEAAFFTLDALPEDLSPRFFDALPRWVRAFPT